MSGGAEAIALDIHAHLVPVDPAGLAGLPGVEHDAARGILVVDGHAVGVKPLYDPAGLVRWMDAQRVERAWISAPPPLYRPQLSAADSRAWSGYLNAGLRGIATRFPGRLAPMCHLPVEHPEVAAEVARELVAEGATRFGAAAGGFSEPVFSAPALDPLWSALDGAGAFLFLHPGHCCDGRLQSFYFENLIGNPYETTVAAAHLVFAGVGARYPRIRFGLAHGGGATAMLAGRWQRGFDTDRPGVDRTREPPRAALRRFWVDSIVHDAQALALSAHVFGDDHIVFGSDWPFPMGLPDGARQLADVDDVLRAKVLRDNAKTLLTERKSTLGQLSRADR